MKFDAFKAELKSSVQSPKVRFSNSKMVKEIETYRNQLSLPYLQDTAFINSMVKDAYFRTKNEVKAKHILVRTPSVATPKDTLEAFNKINHSIFI